MITSIRCAILLFCFVGVWYGFQQWNLLSHLSRQSTTTTDSELGNAPISNKLFKAAIGNAPAVSVSNNLERANATIVTAYFELPSKHSSSNYLQWMSNFLSIQDAVVIYTTPGMVSTMLQYRVHALNKTKVVAMELNELPLAQAHSAEFWKDQFQKDFEKKHHQSYELFWIWLSKPWFITRTIQDNPFESNIFVWSDIGCFRNGRYNGKEIVQHAQVIPRHAILWMAHHQPNAPDTVWWMKKRNTQNFYHSGSMAAGYRDTWLLFYQHFNAVVNGFIERNLFIGEDQAVLQSTCLQYDICEYIPLDQVNDNHYFGLRYALHVGGSYNTWKPPTI